MAFGIVEEIVDSLAPLMRAAGVADPPERDAVLEEVSQALFAAPADEATRTRARIETLQSEGAER